MRSDPAHEDVRAELLRLELRLIQPKFRRDRAEVEKLLAPDFVEFGSSGKIWSRAEILSHLETESYTPPEISNLGCRMLCEDVALVMYRSVHASTETREQIEVVRSSIWRRDGAGWQLCFHQGTRAKPTEIAG